MGRAGESTVAASARLRTGNAGMRIRPRLVLLAAFPALVLMVAVFALPIVQTVQLSFSDWRGFGPIDFIGFGNYVDVLTGNEFWDSLRLTTLFSVLATAGIVLCALLLAVGVTRGQRGDSVFRAVWFLPAIVPGTAAAVFWGISVQPNSGVINEILGFLGLGNDHAWLASPATALYVVIGVAIWISTAFPFLLLAGAIDRVPVEVYEAARIDGAGQWRQFWYFTLPLIRPVLTMVVALQLIWNFNAFTLVWAMTKGGPAGSTTILPVLLYQEGFKNGDFGTAATMGVLSSLLLIALGAITLRRSAAKAAGE
jgi:raffinose/stachyose/melibiose transport system permease protein